MPLLVDSVVDSLLEELLSVDSFVEDSSVEAVLLSYVSVVSVAFWTCSVSSLVEGMSLAKTAIGVERNACNVKIKAETILENVFI